jgi:hypothetical protein
MPSPLHLPHLAAHDLVLGDAVAGEGNAAHVRALAGIDEELDVHRAVIVDLRHALAVANV